MKKSWSLMLVPALVTLGACGQDRSADAADIVTTNAGNVVLNDAQAGYAFRGDNEQVGNQPAASEQTSGQMTMNAQ